MKALVRVENISKRFGDFAALDDASLDIPKGKITGLLGPNGAGKTTMIRILCHITAPDEGRIILESDPAMPLRMGYLPEERGLYRRMKVWEQALYLVQLKGLSASEAEQSLRTWFERMDMTGWVNKRVDSLSKGMQQRLQFVVTVAHQPDFLILDEPFSGFDPVNAEMLKGEILRLREDGCTIVLSTHNMSSVEEMCDHICLINKGKVMLNGSLENIRKSFEQSMYEVVFRGNRVGFATALGHQFEIVRIEEREGTSTAVIKGHGSVRSNDLLNALTRQVEIIGFREKLPSMNDIFLDMVTEREEVAA